MKKTVCFGLIMLTGTCFAGEFGGLLKWTSGYNARFQNGGISGSYANDPGSAGANASHAYDNGYVRNNSTVLGYTPDWGFNSKSQVIPIGGDYNNGATISYSSASSASRAGVDQSVDCSGESGFELFYRDALWRRGRMTIGYMAAFSHQRVEAAYNGIAYLRSESTHDTYTYNGVFPNVGSPLFTDPYDNTDPMLWMPDSPARSVSSQATAYRYRRELDATLLGVKAGPNCGVQLMDRLFLNAGFGVALHQIQSEFYYTEGVASGRTEDNAWLWGAYVQGEISFAVNESCHLFTGAEWSVQESFSQTVDGYEAGLDGDSLITGRLGISFLF